MRELANMVHKVQEARLQVAEIFESRFEDLVTGGRAGEYAGLVERFKEKFDACSGSLIRLADALDSRNATIASLVRKVISAEGRHFTLLLELQVLRQRYSLLSIDDPDQPELKEILAAKQRDLSVCTACIYEALEELREEAADLP